MDPRPVCLSQSLSQRSGFSLPRQSVGHREGKDGRKLATFRKQTSVMWKWHCWIIVTTQKPCATVVFALSTANRCSPLPWVHGRKRYWKMFMRKCSWDGIPFDSFVCVRFHGWGSETSREKRQIYLFSVVLRLFIYENSTIYKISYPYSYDLYNIIWKKNINICLTI